MEEKPRPSWFRGVVEGDKSKDAPVKKSESIFTPVEANAEPEGAPRTRSKELLSTSNLESLYADLSRMPPADFDSRVRPERVREHAEVLPSWTPETLYKYLSKEDVWARASLTRAVFDEIRARMILGTMSARIKRR